MAKKVQLMTNPKQWQVIDGVEVLVDVPQEDLDPITDSSCVEIEGHRTLEETISQENMFTPEIVETKVHSKVGGVYHDNVVDSAYEEAILYGNTQVNLVESMTSGAKYIPHSFTSFQGNESKIGIYHSGRTNQVAPLVKGVTMVNLCQETSAELAQGQGLWVENVKGNTKYTIMFDFPVQNTHKGIMIQSYSTDTMLEISSQRGSLGERANYTFITHADATNIKILNASGYGGETIQLDNIMVIEGDVTDLNLPFFKGMRSVELSRPLTNLFTDGLRWGNQGTIEYTNSGGNVTVTSNSVQTWAGITFYLDTLKQNTKYLVMWDSLTQTQTSTTSSSIIAVYDVTRNVNIGTANSKEECPTLRSIVFDTTGKDNTNIGLRVHATLSNSETGTTTVKGLRVFEWDDSLRTLDLQTIGYFSGTKYVSVRALETEGKNLYPYGDVNFTPTDDKVDNWYDAKGAMYMYGDVAQKSKSRFLLKKGTYTIRFGTWSNIDAFQLIDDKETLRGKIQSMATPTTFTLEQDTYCTLRLKATSKNVATTVTGIQIERGETATTYEAYQSSYYKPRETEEIILRSLPNGVCDTFNLQTGELVQNIEKFIYSDDVVATDARDGGVSNTLIQGAYTCVVYPNNVLFNFAINKFNNSLGILESTKFDQDTRGMYVNQNNIVLWDKTVTSADEFKAKYWGMEVIYQLDKPIITKLQTYDRIYNGQTNALMSMGNNLSALTYYSNNYYLKVGNLSPVPAILEPITAIPYDVRLKPSTLYTVKYYRGGASNSMKFDLGGSVVEKTNSITGLTGIAEELTVRTPAILSHEQLILSGTGFAHNFIVVEGDITGTELPYFEGMKDVKMPIVKNVGKNLLDESTMTIVYGDGITLRYYKAFACKPNTIYHFRANNGETMCNWYSSTDPNTHIGMGIGLENITYLQYSATIKTPADCKYLVIYMGGEPSIDPYSIKSAVYEDGSSLSYESHKENSVYAVQGEYPITSEMFEQGGFSASLSSTYETMKNDNTTRLRSKDLIPVKPNTTYAFAHSFSKFTYNVYQWNGNKKYIEGIQYSNSGQIKTITTTADTQYIHFLMSKHDASQAITVAEYDWSQFHMYELDSTINLRSLLNGVKDELNLLTGEYIQRVGEVVLDGSEEWVLRSSNNYIIQAPFNGGAKEGGYLITDSSVEGVVGSYIVGDYTNHANKIGFSGGLVMYDSYTTPFSGNVNMWKNYLQSNPITVQYELAEPIISHVRLVSNNQEREVGVKLPQGQVNTYNPSTGITTVRVGKIVLDGSESWYFSTTKTNTQVFGLTMSDIAMTQDNLYCETMRVASGIDAEIIATNGGGLFIALLKTKASTVEELRAYLASNPITVWYELKYPQIQPDIVLPNGVHDEYNPETGVYTKKVGFIEFDGSEDWTAKDSNGELQQAAVGAVDMYGVWTAQSLPNVKPASGVNSRALGVCDSLSFKNEALDGTNEEFYFISASGRFNMNIAKTKLTGSNVSHLKEYLSQNPIKLWYELETPITYQLTPYFGLPQPYAYEDGYLIHDSAYAKTTLPPEFKYKLVANRIGQVMQNNRKLQEHTTRLSDLEALIIEATIESLFNRELQLFELELMDIQLIDLGE